MKKILVVDDDRLFRSTMRRHLELLGYAVMENDSGVGVRLQVEQEQPVVCLIDMVMEEKEGIETILEIIKLPNRPKIISVSSNRDYLEMAVALGADSMLSKPVSPEKLAQALGDLLG